MSELTIDYSAAGTLQTNTSKFKQSRLPPNDFPIPEMKTKPHPQNPNHIARLPASCFKYLNSARHNRDFPHGKKKHNGIDTAPRVRLRLRLRHNQRT